MADGAADRGAARTVLRSPVAWAVTGFMGLQSLQAYALIGWIPTIYRDRGMSAEAGGAMLGRAHDRRGRRLIDVGVLEKAQRELLAQQAPRRHVEALLGHEAVADESDEEGGVMLAGQTAAPAQWAATTPSTASP